MTAKGSNLLIKNNADIFNLILRYIPYNKDLFKLEKFTFQIHKKEKSHF